MLIDLHCHTKQAKKGDVGREVDLSTFVSKIKEAKVEIVAITNHNIFNKEQFELFTNNLEDVLLLPGIELDIVGNRSGKDVFGHIIVISDPKNVDIFSNIVEQNCKASPDDFTMTIDNFCKTFGQLKNCIILCHYKKTKEITYDDYLYIKENIDKNNVVLLEPSNSRRAGVIIRSDRESSWFGSDNKNWDSYPLDCNEKKLPECIFKIRDYNALLSLLKNNQDAALLKTYLNKRGPEIVKINPFPDLNLDLELYHHTNVVFGAKATGKTEILKAIEQAFVLKGKTVSSFYIEDKKQNLISMLDYHPCDDDLKDFRERKCGDEISKIKNWTWLEIPSLNKFLKAKQSEEALRVKDKAKIINAKFIEILDDSTYKEKCNEYLLNKEKIDEVININKDDYLSSSEIKELHILLDSLKDNWKDNVLQSYFDYHAKYLEKYSIELLGNKIANLQGAVKSPSSFGLIRVYEEKKNIEQAINNINSCLDTTKTLDDYKIGILPTKGIVYRTTRIGFKQLEKSIHSEFKVKMLNDSNKKDAKELEKLLKNVSKSNEVNDYLDNIDKIKRYLNENNINDLIYFINYLNTFKTIDNDDFKPSNGETSILLVDYAINKPSSDVIILDEPDSGMGADYINDTLIPAIKSQADNNKVVIISTHDPNLVVRTHPYQCIYREEYSTNKYSTYHGSSFEESMINYTNEQDERNWIKTCVEKCEGGEEAIIERERTYGHY